MPLVRSGRRTLRAGCNGCGAVINVPLDAVMLEQARAFIRQHARCVAPEFAAYECLTCGSRIHAREVERRRTQLLAPCWLCGGVRDVTLFGV